MKKVIFQMSVSLDGYVEGPDHAIDWHIVDDEFNAYAGEMLVAAETLIMGRKTYELMARYWPTAEDDDLVKEQMNDTPKLVFSRTLKKVAWKNSRLATGTIAEEVARLKEGPGGGLLPVGGSDLAATFLAQGLVDELRIIMTPVLLGGGKTVFSGITKRYALTLTGTKTFKSGSVVMIYEPAAPALTEGVEGPDEI